MKYIGWTFDTITEEEFGMMFPQVNIKLFTHVPETDEELLSTFLPSKLWRLNNLYTIVNKWAKKQIFKMNYSQFYVYSLKVLHPRTIILKSRQQGISTLFLIDFYDDMLVIPDLSVGMMAQDKPAAKKLLERVKLLESELNPAIKEFLELQTVTDNTDELGFSNGSKMYIRTSFRSTTLQRLHVSEYGKIAAEYPEKIEELKTGTLQALAQGNIAIIESTAEGHNDFKLQWDKSVLNKAIGALSPLDFQPIFLSWLEDPDCRLDFEKPIDQTAEKYFEELGKPVSLKQKWFWIAKREELGARVYQEYPATPDEAFQLDVEGAYYMNEYRTLKIQPNLYNEQLAVHLTVDLGMNDDFPVIFWQKWPDGHIKIIGEYVSNNNGLQHYANVCKALSLAKGWCFGRTYVPHDVKVKEMTSDKTRWETMVKLGFRPILVKRHKLADGIEITRQFLKKVEVDSSCTMVLSTIQNYRKKYDKKFGIYLDEPVHDVYSHPADALRQLAVGDKNSPISINEIWAIPKSLNYSYGSIKSNGFDI